MVRQQSAPSPPSDALVAQNDEFRRRYDAIKSKAAELEAQFAALAIERAELLTCSCFAQAPPDLYMRLSDELIQRIFVLAKPEDIPTCIPFSRTVAPMQLTQVCSRWRDIAHDTPALWKDLKCAVYLPPGRYKRHEAVAFVQSWISRAAYMPLSILAVPSDAHSTGPPDPSLRIIPQGNEHGLFCSPPAEEAVSSLQPWLLEANKFNFIKDIVDPNAPRVRDLYLCFPEYFRHASAFLQETPDFSLLEDVTLDFSAFTTAFFSPPMYSCFLEDTPRLQKVKLVSFEMKTSTQLSIDWSKITHFDIGVIHSTLLRDILSQTKSLQSCRAIIQSNNDVRTFTFQGNPSGHVIATRVLEICSTITLPSLCILDLATDEHVKVESSWLSALELPKLNVLSIASEEWYSLSTALLKTTTSLHELSLIFHGLKRDGSLRAILKHPALSDLTHLTVRTKDSSSDYLNKKTTEAIIQGHLIPRLHTLHFEGSLDTDLFIHLLTKKGFAHDGGSVIHPGLTTGTQPNEGGVGIAAPFQMVHIHRCRNRVLVKSSTLREIQKLVGSDRFVIESTEECMKDIMYQVDWYTDD